MIFLKNGKKSAKYRYQLQKRRRMEKYGSFLHSECPICGEDTFFYDRYDSIVCFRCDVWFNKACNDPNCPFCAGRPDFPSEAMFLEEENNTQWSLEKERRISVYERKYKGETKHNHKKICIRKRRDL